MEGIPTPFPTWGNPKHGVSLLTHKVLGGIRTPSATPDTVRFSLTRLTVSLAHTPSTNRPVFGSSPEPQIPCYRTVHGC